MKLYFWTNPLQINNIFEIRKLFDPRILRFWMFIFCIFQFIRWKASAETFALGNFINIYVYRCLFYFCVRTSLLRVCLHGNTWSENVRSENCLNFNLELEHNANEKALTHISGLLDKRCVEQNNGNCLQLNLYLIVQDMYLIEGFRVFYFDDDFLNVSSSFRIVYEKDF